MNIGDAAKASGVSAKMIRYYEQIKLIPQSDRTTAGYRSYSSNDIHGLRFVRKSRDLGFSINEISNLLALWSDRSRKSADVKTVALGHINDLEKRISEMQQMSDVLKTLVNCCAGDERPDCPILDSLESSEKPAVAITKRTGSIRPRKSTKH